MGERNFSEDKFGFSSARAPLKKIF